MAAGARARDTERARAPRAPLLDEPGSGARPLPLNACQLAYACGFQGVGSAAINGAINAGVSLLATRGAITWLPLFSFLLEETFLQSFFTYLIASTLAAVDVRFGVLGLQCARVPAVAPSPGDARFGGGCAHGPRVEWLLLVETDGVGGGYTLGEWCAKLGRAVRKALVFALGVALTLGAAGELAAAVVYRPGPISAYPTSLWLKVGYAAFVALVTTPLVAYAAMYTVGRALAAAERAEHAGK